MSKEPKRYCDKHDVPYERMSSAWRCRKCVNEYNRRYQKGQTKKRKAGGGRTSREYYDKRNYGLSPEESRELRSRGRCDACGTLEGDAVMVIDHDHATLKVRGLLCRHCNLVLGHAKDNPQLLRMLADYLERP